MNFESYNPENFYDEYFEKPGQPRAEVKKLVDQIQSFPYRELANRQKAAEAAFMQMGIEFLGWANTWGFPENLGFFGTILGPVGFKEK